MFGDLDSYEFLDSENGFYKLFRLLHQSLDSALCFHVPIIRRASCFDNFVPHFEKRHSVAVGQFVATDLHQKPHLADSLDGPVQDELRLASRLPRLFLEIGGNHIDHLLRTFPQRRFLAEAYCFSQVSLLCQLC